MHVTFLWIENINHVHGRQFHMHEFNSGDELTFHAGGSRNTVEPPIVTTYL